MRHQWIINGCCLTPYSSYVILELMKGIKSTGRLSLRSSSYSPFVVRCLFYLFEWEISSSCLPFMCFMTHWTECVSFLQHISKAPCGEIGLSEKEIVHTEVEKTQLTMNQQAAVMTKEKSRFSWTNPAIQHVTYKPLGWLILPIWPFIITYTIEGLT